MNSKKIEIEVPAGKNAEWVNGVLTLVDEKDNRPVTERIKTFEDACKELGEEHPFVVAYDAWIMNEEFDDQLDIIAYLKLRIIAAALNEGWKPQFTKMNGDISLGSISILKKRLMKWTRKKKAVWCVGRTTMRMRMAVLRMRVRTTIHRTRMRSLGLGLPSRRASLRNTQVSSS